VPKIQIPKGWKLTPPQLYQQGNRYCFPFMAVDTLGNLGRIEWHLEPFRSPKHRGHYLICGLLVWATQTRDPRYSGRIFHIPMITEALTSSTYSGRASRDGSDYFHHSWLFAFCTTHRMPFFSAYPADEHTELVVETGSGVSNRVYFR